MMLQAAQHHEIPRSTTDNHDFFHAIEKRRKSSLLRVVKREEKETGNQSSYSSMPKRSVPSPSASPEEARALCFRSNALTTSCACRASVSLSATDAEEERSSWTASSRR